MTDVKMPSVSRPALLGEQYGHILRSPKSEFVSPTKAGTSVSQYGAASVALAGWPGWPAGLSTADAVIETFVAGQEQVDATSDNEPFVSAWTPLALWMNVTIRAALADIDVQLAGDAYVTASLTATDMLEGLAHLDDDLFVPDDSVAMVAIIGELAGPRIATAPIDHVEVRPMTQLTFADASLAAFANNELDRCAANADELVVFPQFGQVHAGPPAHHVAHLAPTRQLLVMRAAVALP